MKKAAKINWRSFGFHALTGGATMLIVLTILVILGNIVWHGAGQISLRFVFGGTKEGMFDAATAGVFPMIFGTLALVVLMTLCVVPVGVITAVYLNEYARDGRFIRLVRLSILNLAGVPSIVFGLFGFGMLVVFFGWNVSLLAGWFTLAFMVLPVVITAILLLTGSQLWWLIRPDRLESSL